MVEGTASGGKTDSVSENLKAHLDSITPEEFKKEWDEIVQMGFGGPTVSEFLEMAKNFPSNKENNEDNN